MTAAPSASPASDIAIGYHRALADALAKRDRYLAICDTAQRLVWSYGSLPPMDDTRRRAGKHPVTPDGHYFVVRGRLWRMSDPGLPAHEREWLVRALMTARRAVGVAKRAGDEAAEAVAHAAVDEAKHGLGERGPVWWNDDAPDFNRHMARNTPYAKWFANLKG